MKHVLEGLNAFAQRYGKVFGAAWSARKEMDPPERSADERAFLPAHLELVESPVSPVSRWVARTIIALFCTALLWSIFGQLDIVAVAPGKTVVGSRTKVVQPAETAVVRRILVRDGQTVRAGQLLIELDSTATSADADKADEALVSARLAALRFAALAAAIETKRAPTLEANVALPADRFEAEQRLASSQFDAFQTKRQGLQAGIDQRTAELHTGQALVHPLEENARIAATRSADYAKLLEGKFVGRHEYLLREQERIAAERDLAAQRNHLAEIRSALVGAREELRALEADFSQQTLDGLRQSREQAAQFAPDVARAAQRNRLMQLRAPVDGTVQQLAVHTIGGVVTPAQPLLAVVPSEQSLEVEATVLNKDIGFVREGQVVTVKVESFPYTRFGYLTGIVQSVSHDAATDEKLGLVFPARIRLEGTTLRIEGVDVHLSAGMSVAAEIKTGKRPAIDYVLGPLESSVGEAMRER